MEATRRWIQTLALTALALAALVFAFRPEGTANAARPANAACKEFIPSDGVASLSVMDPIRMWMNEQLEGGHTSFVVLARDAENRAVMMCGW